MEMESRSKTGMGMASTRSGGGVGLRGVGVQVLGYRGFLMVALLFLTATTFVIEDVHCSISTDAVAPAPTPSTQQTQNIGMFKQYEADALNAVFKMWSKQNPQLSTFLNWSLKQHPCDNLTDTDALSYGYAFQGAWGGVGCQPELHNVTELAKYYHISVTSLKLSGSNFSCLEYDGYIRAPCGFDGITGELPSEISKLTNLQHITISHNPRLTGPVPVELFQMRNLTALDLSNNSLSGTLPSNVYNADCQLNSLDLSNNNFSGSLRVSSQRTVFCSNLYELNVGFNQLDGPIDLQDWNLESQFISL